MGVLVHQQTNRGHMSSFGVVLVLLVAGVVAVSVIKALLAQRRGKQASAAFNEEAPRVSRPAVPAHVWSAMNVHLSGADIRNAEKTTIENIVFDVHDRYVLDRGNETCAAVRCKFAVGANFPQLLLTRGAAAGIGSMHKIRFEFDAFNEVFCTIGVDDRFAFSLFTGEMMQWCLQQPALQEIDIMSEAVVVSFDPRHGHADHESVLAFAWGFLTLVPQNVWKECAIVRSPASAG